MFVAGTDRRCQGFYVFSARKIQMRRTTVATEELQDCGGPVRAPRTAHWCCIGEECAAESTPSLPAEIVARTPCHDPRRSTEFRLAACNGGAPHFCTARMWTALPFVASLEWQCDSVPAAMGVCGQAPAAQRGAQEGATMRPRSVRRLTALARKLCARNGLARFISIFIYATLRPCRRQLFNRRNRGSPWPPQPFRQTSDTQR